jgi:hypothetical protein
MILALVLIGTVAICHGQDHKGANWANTPIGHVQSQALAATNAIVTPAPEAAQPVAPADAPAQINEGLTDKIIALAERYPVVASLLLLLGALRFVIKPVMTAIHFFVASTESKKDDEMLAKVEHSWLFTGFLFLVDWIASIKLKPSSTPRSALRVPRSTVGCWLLVVGCLGLVACNTPRPVGQIGVGVNPDGTVSNVNAGVSWDPSTNVNVTVGGQLNPATGEWFGNLLITFKELPDPEMVMFAVQARAELLPSKGTTYLYKLPFNSSNRDHRIFVAEAQRRGAKITGEK